MSHHHHRSAGSAAITVAAVLASALVAAAGARADDSTCPSSTGDAYRMKLQALTGPAGADLTLTVDAAVDGCAVPKALKKIQVKTYAADGTLERTRNFTDRDAPKGVANIDLGELPRDRRVEADVLVDPGTSPRTYVVHAATKTLLRPDLVVTKVVSKKQTLVGSPVSVTAVIAEQNGDVGATATAHLSAIPGSAEPVEIPRGGETTVKFNDVSFGSAVPVDLKVDVSAASPGETDAANNSRSARIDVTENALPEQKNVLFPSLGGYGAQFNNHLYAPISTAKIPADEYPDIEQKVKDLEPQLVRIFYNDNWEENADRTHPSPEFLQNYDSVVKVIQLAQESGAIVDVSYQNLANARTTPAASMAKFAAFLEDVVKAHGLTNVHWAEVGNEPNSGNVTLDQYNALYRALDAQLKARGLRTQIQLMGGGLVENAVNPARDHYAWMKWIGANMSDVVDAYAEHIYWTYNDAGRLEYRLRDTWHLMNEVLPPEQRKPVYMMEFGIRGFNTCGTKPVLPTQLQEYYRDDSCTDIWRTNIAGFQQLWFNVDAAQLGVAGTSKWDAFWAVYDRNSVNQQLYWMTGPPGEDYPLTPTYNAMWLFFHVTAPGWQIIGVDPWQADDSSVPRYETEGHASNDQPEKELAAYSGPNGELTIIGLDTHGRDLNSVATDPAPSYSIGGLPPNTTFDLDLWNATGDGTNTAGDPVTTNDAGVARFDVPLQAAFALTTVPIS